MFSKACEYAIKASIFIADKSHKNNKASLIEIANAIDSPVAYTSKILQKLVKNGVMQSDKGPTGGFSIVAEKLSELKLCTVVSAIDGDAIYKGCGLGLSHCNEKLPCPVHNQFKLVRDELKNMLESTTLFSLTTDLNNGLTFLKR